MKTSKALLSAEDEVGVDSIMKLERIKLDFALQLETLRKNKQMSYEDIAKSLGTSKAYVCRVFRGDVDYTLEFMFKLVKVLGGQLNGILLEPEAYLHSNPVSIQSE